MKHFYNLLKSLVLITCVFMAAGAQKSWAADFTFNATSVNVDDYTTDWWIQFSYGSERLYIDLYEDYEFAGDHDLSHCDPDYSYYTYSDANHRFTILSFHIDGTPSNFSITGSATMTDGKTVEFSYGDAEPDPEPFVPDYSHIDIEFEIESIKVEYAYGVERWISFNNEALNLDFLEYTGDPTTVYSTSTSDFDLDDRYTNYDGIAFIDLADVTMNGDPNVEGACTELEGYGTLSDHRTIHFYMTEPEPEDPDYFDESEYTALTAINVETLYNNSKPSVETVDDECVWKIALNRNTTIYIKANEDGTFKDTYTSSDFVGITNRPSKTSSYTFVKVKDVVCSGNLNDVFEISGMALVSNSTGTTWRVLSFSYTQPEPEHFDIEGTLVGVNTGYGSYWDIEIDDALYREIHLRYDASNDFAVTNFTLSNCDAANTYAIINGQNRKFTELTFTVTGFYNKSREIIGEGVLTTGDDVSFHYVDTQETVGITAAGWATYYNPTMAVTLPEGIEGYVAYIAGGAYNFKKAYDALQVVPANTPIVLKGETGSYVFRYTTGGTAPAANDLRGAATDITAEEMATANPGKDWFYHLAMNSAGKVGFFWKAAEGAAFALEAGKAYLPVASSALTAGARSGFAFDDMTGITEVKAEAQQAVTYNLQGQRVSEAKGLVVRDGKMMFVK